MDFSFSEEQQAVADLAAQIMVDRCTHEHLRELEAAGSFFDAGTWAALGEAGLVGISLADDVGGAGLDLVAAGAVHIAMGHHVAPLPLWPHTVATVAVDHHGTAEQRRRLLPEAATGATVFTIALQEYLSDQLDSPDTTATADGDQWRLSGTKIVVEFWEQASWVLVTAATNEGDGLFLVATDADGITATGGVSTRRQPVHEILLDGVVGEPIGARGQGAVSWVNQRALALLCATQIGVVDKALRLTAEYTSTREQFGRPLATFQAVTQRLADQYIHREGVRLTALAALWELATGRDAREHLHMAKWFASDWAHELAHATQHVHGGMGVSVDYPLFRYTLWNKHIECSLGAGTQHLRQLGQLLAAG